MTLVVYPGTFDPLTLGHQDVVQRVAAHHEAVIVAVSDSRKSTLFTLAERLDMAKAILTGLANVRVMHFTGLVTEFARQQGAGLIVRGLRDASDFDYERRMASLNRTLLPAIDTTSSFRTTATSPSPARWCAKLPCWAAMSAPSSAPSCWLPCSRNTASAAHPQRLPPDTRPETPSP